MYESWFGLRERPFALTPNTRFFLAAQHHRDALELLTMGLAHGEGFIKVSGEVGTGKTLLCRTLLNHLQGRAITAYLPNPHLAPHDLYRAVAGALRDGSAAGGEAPGAADWYPGLESGLRTMAFVEAVLESAKSQEKWTAFPATGLVTQPF